MSLFSNLLYAKYYSQPATMQDKYLNETIFKNKKNGFFVDIGAYDGITHSNTYFFEKKLNSSLDLKIEHEPEFFTGFHERPEFLQKGHDRSELHADGIRFRPGRTALDPVTCHH